MKPIRSFLFVPGNRESMLDKATNAGADALILDLEDSVPAEEKVAARELVARKIPELVASGQRVWVRVNKSLYLYDFDDLLAVVQPGLEGVYVSKPNGPEDIHTAASMISEAESRAGMAIGSVAIMPILETARSMELCFEIAQHPRVAGLIGATAKNGDINRALNYVWTAGGRETDYLKSRVVMAARAAGKMPIGGLWQQIRDLDGLEQASRLDRQFGMAGVMVLHPAQVPVVNRVFTPTEDEIRYYQGMIAALEAAQADGRASAMYDGEHIDIAHVKTAREIIDLASNLES